MGPPARPEVDFHLFGDRIEGMDSLVHLTYCRTCESREYCWSRNVVVKGFIRALIREGMTEPGELMIMARTFVRTRYFRERMKKSETARSITAFRNLREEE